MTDNKTTKTIVCFGEILWDIFPTGRKIGGAPFNVAYNLTKMGIDARMISSVGNDDLGKELLAEVSKAHISTDECQIDPDHNTGTVIAQIDEHNEAHYTIVEPVAWDYIRWKDEYENLVKNSEAFVFGSLGTRNNVSFQTLQKLLDLAPYKVFDINLRPPFISQKNIIQFMEKSDLVKMNKAELRQLLDWIGVEYVTEEVAIQYIREYFNLQAVIITKGSKGAVYSDRDNYIYKEAVKVEIKDTVGSGDSFLAGFLAMKVKGETVERSIENAIALGAFITNSSGACPNYSMEDFEHFKVKNI